MIPIMSNYNSRVHISIIKSTELGESNPVKVRNIESNICFRFGCGKRPSEALPTARRHHFSVWRRNILNYSVWHILDLHRLRLYLPKRKYLQVLVSQHGTSSDAIQELTNKLYGHLYIFDDSLKLTNSNAFLRRPREIEK